jgi:hypothetical protein
MYVDDNGLNCCGIREISDLHHCRTAASAIRQFIYATEPIDYGGYNSVTYRRDKFRYAIFSGINKGSAKVKYVDRLKAYILENKLGEVVETGWNVNPNSNNKLKVCVWTIDWEALKTWKEKQEAKNGKRKPSTPVTPDYF